MIYTYNPTRNDHRGGRRFVVMFYEGRKWLKLLDTGTLEIYRRPLAEQRHLRPYKIKPKTLANRLTKRRALFNRHGAPYPKRSVTQAITLLRSQSL